MASAITRHLSTPKPDEATIRTRDGLLIQVLHLRGFPFETQPDEELNYRKTVRETLPEGFQRSEFLLEHGSLDMIVDRREMRDRIGAMLRMLLGKEPAAA